MLQFRWDSRKYGRRLGIATVGFFLLWVALIISGVLPRHVAEPVDLPNLLLGGLVDEEYGGIESYVDTKVIPVTDTSKLVWDRRTGFRISVLDLGSLTGSCPTHVVIETPRLLAVSQCLLVFVVEKEARKLEAITTLPDFEERGKAIMGAVSRGLPTIPAGQVHATAAGKGGGAITSFDEVAARDLVSRFRDLCEAQKLGQMQSLMDPLRILVYSRQGIVIDLRTRYRISFERIKALRGTCPQQEAFYEGGVQVVTFCEHTGYRVSRVVFVVSPDWKIRAITDEATWKSRGEEILSEIPGKLTSIEAGADEVGQRSKRREEPTPTPEPR